MEACAALSGVDELSGHRACSVMQPVLVWCAEAREANEARDVFLDELLQPVPVVDAQARSSRGRVWSAEAQLRGDLRIPELTTGSRGQHEKSLKKRPWASKDVPCASMTSL